jgi:hypothetical protein
VLPTVNAIWIGRELGQIGSACLRSFSRHGHRVVLHCYARPRDTPPGIEIADANILIPQSRIIRHRETGSLTIFSDLLRYEILGAGLGLYVDCDMFCLRPIEDAEFIFGWERSDSVNSAILKLPIDCPALVELRSIKNSLTFKPWHKGGVRRRISRWLKGKRPATSLEDLSWGTTGPVALTYYLKKHGLAHLASPIDRFYPVHYTCVPLLFDPALSLKDITTHRTDALHLYQSNFWRSSRELEIPKGSPIWELLNSE